MSIVWLDEIGDAVTDAGCRIASVVNTEGSTMWMQDTELEKDKQVVYALT